MEQQFIDYVQQNPGATRAEVAEYLGVPESKVKHLALTTGTRTDLAIRRRKWTEDLNAKPTHGAKVTKFKGDGGEYQITADLIRRGFQVFKALSHTAPFDLVVLNGDDLMKVECKTGWRGENGLIKWTSVSDYSRFDILAVALSDGTCIYSLSSDNPMPPRRG